MIKHTDLCASSGTSWFGHSIITTAQRLTDLFGPESFDAPSCDGSQREWVLRTDAGQVVTIYDRCYHVYDINELVRWHIGAHSSYNAMVGTILIKQMLNQS